MLRAPKSMEKPNLPRLVAETCGFSRQSPLEPPGPGGTKLSNRRTAPGKCSLCLAPLSAPSDERRWQPRSRRSTGRRRATPPTQTSRPSPFSPSSSSPSVSSSTASYSRSYLCPAHFYISSVWSCLSFFFGRRLSQFIFMEHEGFGGSDEC